MPTFDDQYVIWTCWPNRYEPICPLAPTAEDGVDRPGESPYRGNIPQIPGAFNVDSNPTGG